MPLVVDPDGVEAATIRDLVDLRGTRVVDLGCGEGRLSFVCAGQGATVHALDADEEAIALARSRTPDALRRRVRFDVADAAQVELPRGEFDLALFSWSL